MHIQNLHTMEELHFTGNCLKGSRPILSFDCAFDKQAHLLLLKELLSHAFGVPENARKAKPFVDRILGFSFADGRVWVRQYQVKENGEAERRNIQLVEIGPRFCLTPIIIQEGSFGGPIIYENREFVSPNHLRADTRKRKTSKYNTRVLQHVERAVNKGNLGLRTHNESMASADSSDSRSLFA